MLDELVLKYGILSIAFLSFIINLAINREKLQPSKLKVEILNDALKVKYRTSQILDFHRQSDNLKDIENGQALIVAFPPSDAKV